MVGYSSEKRIINDMIRLLSLLSFVSLFGDLLIFTNAQQASYISMNCYEGRFYSDYDETVQWFYSWDYFLNGMDSFHDNGKEDRQFKMRYCGASDSQYRGFTSGQVLPYTDWDDHWIRGCGGNSGIYRVYSYHDNGKEDRKFSVYCGNVGKSDGNVQLNDCNWYGYYPNNWDDPIDFECPNNGIIRTIESYHDNPTQDRKYKFECCRMIESQVSLVTMAIVQDDFFTNEWDGIHNNLRSGYFLSGLYSVHDNGKEDRRFQWKYGKPSGENSGYISYYTLDWTSYDAEWTVSCLEYNNGDSALIRGYSTHDNGKEDREWQFRCGNLDSEKYSLDNCAYTGYLNTWDDPVDFDCPNNGIIRSIWSRHDNGKEDRLWRFECCHVVEADYQFTNLEGFWNKIIGPIGVGTISRSVTIGISTTNGQEITESYSESLSIAVSAGFEYSGVSGGIEITGEIAHDISTTISDEITLSSEITDTMSCSENVQYLYQFYIMSDEATVATTSFWCTNVVNPACGPGYFDCQMGDPDCNTCLDSWPTS